MCNVFLTFNVLIDTSVAGFYEQKQQEQVFFTPNQSPVPPPPPTSSSTYPASYEPTGQAPPAVPARPVSPSQYTQTIVSTASPGFSIHSIDEWQRRQDEDLNQIYCTIRRNHEVNRLKESGRLVSPQPQEQRSRSSHQLYQKEVQSSAQSTARPVCHLQPETLSIIGRPMYMHNSERPQPIDLQPSTVSASHQLLTASACTTNRSTVETFAPIPPTRPLIPPSRELTTVAVCSLSPSKCVTAPVSAASQAGFALHANPTKKRTLIEQTYYDRERFDDCQVPKPISLDRKWTEARLDGDWSSLQEPSTQSYQHRLPPVDGKALSDLECSGFRSRKALPVSQRQPAIGYNTIGRTGIGSSSQCNGFDSLGLRSSASLGNLPSATCSSPIVAGGSLSALSGSKGHSISLAEDVNNVSFAHHPQDDDDDLDKLIKKIEQDAIIQDELGELFSSARNELHVAPA